MIAVATLALIWAQALHVSLGLAFLAALILSWLLEGTRWQLSERTGLILVLLSIPVFYLDWSYQSGLKLVTGDEIQTNALVSAIAHLIVVLSVIKLFQVKSDRDWVFIYLISFFEILLAAGLSFSPVFLASLTVYLICSVSTVIAFEIRKARRGLKPVDTRLLVSPDSALFRRAMRRSRKPGHTEVKRLPMLSVGLLLLIAVLALPLFLMVPRAGAGVFTRSGGGLGGFVGFSENVQLGEIGTLKENNQVVMHVRIEDAGNAQNPELRWRGVALDEFTGRGWKKSIEARRTEQRVMERCGNGGTGCGVFQLDTAEAPHRLTTQTVFLEPMDSPVIFAAPRAVAVQGPFSILRRDADGSIQGRRHEFERLIYKAVSDTTTIDPNVLRRDMRAPSAAYARYFLPPVPRDPRIEQLAAAMIRRARAYNNYDAVRAIESGLRNEYSYTLDMKASGEDPLADFLFNVRAGHCEYFSTAMAVMLRTQGIPARVVNGFLTGEYNEAAGAYTVRQSDAHSWVEVYFPSTDSWVTFDPTPPAGRVGSQRGGLAGWFGKYAEAFELVWFQYVIGYDKQEQRSLANSLNNRLFRYQGNLSNEFLSTRKLSTRLLQRSLLLVAACIIGLMLFFLIRRIIRFGWRAALTGRPVAAGPASSAVEFYERLTRLLAEGGFKRGSYQTPLEFASSLRWQEVMRITQAYNRVRYGTHQLGPSESRQIEEWLRKLESSLAVPTPTPR
jgi:protein-glutamine gamma-glutamyltransferase